MLKFFVLSFTLAASLFAREALLLRYPTYHQGRIAFSHMGDIWTVDENGGNLQRLTVHSARDIYPRYSPDGKWIAFSSDRAGNLDVYIIPTEGGNAKQLTFHSADDNVLDWSPDSRSVLFASQRGEDFMGKLYTVSIDGGMERNAGADMGTAGSYSPDGKKLAINRKGQVYWRKYYRGSFQTDVTVMDIASKKFTDITDYDGLDSWPMWGHDGYVYFVSDREDVSRSTGVTNIWRVSEKGGKAEKVTQFKTGDVRFPSISSDGKTIVFEHDFGLWKMNVAGKQTSQVKVNIAAELQENLAEVRDFNSRVDDYSLSPNSRRIAFSIHGEVFTAPVAEGDLRQITDNPSRDQDPLWSPDGKQLAFLSDRSGREEIYVIAADGGDALKITDMDNLKSGMAWSPDSKEIAFTTSENKLHQYSLSSKQTIELASSKYGNIGSVSFSPDGKWIVLTSQDETRTTGVSLVPSAGGAAPRKVTFDSSGDNQPRFSADGKKIYFIRSDRGVQGTLVGGTPSSQIYVVALEKQDKDPSDPDENAPAEGDQPAAGPRRGGAGAGPAAAAPVKEVVIDWDGLKRRTEQVTRMPFPVFNYAAAHDNKTLVFATTEPGALRPTPVIYSIQDDGKRLTRVASVQPAADATGGRGGRGGGGGFGGIRGLTVARDGRSVFYMEGGSVYSNSLGAPAGGAAASASPLGGGARRRVTFTAKVKVNKPAEWAEMFGDAWRTMKYRFYDANMHGRNWDAMRSKYQPLVEFVGDKHELLNIVNEMIGELNASHTGAAPGPAQRAEGAAVTSHLGLELEADEQAGRYRVTHVYEDGPSDKDWVKVKNGDYLIAIEGTPVLATDNYWKLLNYRLNKKVTVTFNSKPNDDGAWKTRIEPIPMAVYSNLRYDRWVNERKAQVEKMTGGKIGYLHIKAMDPPSLKKFEKEIHENRDKKALIIDQRFNGGGNIEQELLAILVQRQYQVWQPRGTEENGRPFAGYFGPKVVLQNWRSASNAEMFPAGFKQLGLGKTIGTPTMGAVIGTGSYSLIDGSTVRTPGVGVYLADGKHTNMENYGVKPDITVENTPEDNLSGRDRQLETAVAELMKQIQ
ncbi:MAG: S41 family peptidase [Bryobacteraceae bacterium]